MALHTSNSRAGRTAHMGVQGTEIRSKGQGELHRWVYSAQRGAEAARESCTDGCADHKEALKKLAVQRASWSSEDHFGDQIGLDSAASADCTQQNCVQEAREGCTRRPRGSKLDPRCVQELRPRNSKLRPRGAQDRPSETQVRPKRLQVGPEIRPRALWAHLGGHLDI